MSPLDKAIKVLDSTHNVVVLAHNDFDGIDMSDEFKRAINCINTAHSQSIIFNKKNTYNINFICEDNMWFWVFCVCFDFLSKNSSAFLVEYISDDLFKLKYFSKSFAITDCFFFFFIIMF